jgi:hypothetical protein
MSPKTIEQWQNYLEGRYNALFDRSAVELVKSASERPMNFQAGEQMATDQLIGPLSATNAPFFGKDLRGQVIVGGTVHEGEPWHEQMCERDLQNGYASQHGFMPFSFDVDVCLSTASQLAKTTGQFLSVNVWHIAFALVSLNPPAFSHAVRTSGTPLSEVIALLRNNAKKIAPAMFKVLSWQAIAQTDDPSSGLYWLAPEDRSVIQHILVQGDFKLSYAVGRALLCAVSQTTKLARITGYAEVGVEHVIAGLLAVGFEDEGMDHAEISLPLKMVTELELSEDDLFDLWNRIRPNVEPSTKRKGWIISEAVLGVLDDAKNLKKQCTKNDPWIAARHLLAAILIRASTNTLLSQNIETTGFSLPMLAAVLRHHLKSYEEVDSSSTWESLIDRLPATQRVNATVTGSKFTPRRNATNDELCLHIDVYAAAIAETIRAANHEDDFVFALYGPWGRGKSTLISKVAGQLTKRIPQESDAPYETVFFSAWKYPTRPEVWVHLFQRLAAAAQSGGWWQKTRISLRVGLVKKGWWPLLFGFGLLAISRLQLDFGHWLFDGMGIIGLLILVSFVWNAIKASKQMANTYFAMPNHAEKLGLQAVIGEDFKQLLEVWTRPQPAKPKENTTPSTCDFSRWWPARWAMISVVALIWTTLGLVAWKIHHNLSGTQAKVTLQSLPTVTVSRDGKTSSEPESAATPTPPMRIEVNAEWQGAKLRWTGTSSLQNSKPQAAQPKSQGAVLFLNLLLGLIGISTPFFAFLISNRPRQCRRVLLVVDDLDRCEPEQMLTVIESLRLFLDEPDMSRRMQVAMLLDRNILKSAMLNRAEAQKMRIAPDSQADFLRQQEEKLFVVSMALPPIDGGMLNTLAKNMVQREVQQQAAAREDRSLSTEPASSTAGATSTVGAASRGQNSPPPPSKASEAESRDTAPDDAKRNSILTEVQFSPEEQSLLVAALAEFDLSNITPRSYRAFVLRYQLVRLILQGFKTVFQPSGVILEIASRLFIPKGDRSSSTLSPEVLTAINSVVIDDR